MADPGPPCTELQRVVVPLGETDPESSPNADAVAVLRTLVEDASLVALGETAHGARAQFRLKHRLIRLLAEEFGIRAFALEADANWVRQVDRYVTDGEGEIQRLLQRAWINWPWKTAELVAMFEWMRAFNEDSPAADRIRVYGFDTSSFERIARTLSSFVDTVDATVPAVRRQLETLEGDDEAAAIGVAATLQETLPSLFDDHEAWAPRCSSDQFAFARRQVTLLRQTRALLSADGADRFGIRDAAMATNASWVVNDAGPARAILWAHNIHVARAEQSGGMPDVPGRTMGDCLAARHGDQYVPIGLGLGGGEYLALDAETMAPVTPSVPEPPAGSIPAAFSRVDGAIPFVRTAALHEREATADWLADRPSRHRISGMVEDGDSLTYVASDLSEFAAFSLVETTEPTRHLGLDR